MAQPDPTISGLELDAELALLEAEDEADARACPLLYFTTKHRPSQKPFFYDESMVCALLSGNKAGKDECLTARLAILFSRGEYEPLDLPGSFAPFRNFKNVVYGRPMRAWYVCPELDLWRSLIVKKLLKYIPKELLDGKKSADGSGYNRGDETIYLLDGSSIVGRSSTGFKQDKGKSEGDDVDVVCLSEGQPEWLFDECMSRILSTNGMIWYAVTRNSKTCSYPLGYIRSRIVRHPPNVKTSSYALSSEENNEAAAKEADELGLSELAKAIRDHWTNTWNTMTEEQRAVQLGGEWSGQAGLVFPTFNETEHIYRVQDVPDAKLADVFTALAAQGYGEIVAGMDHGKGHPTVVTYFYVAKRPIEGLRLIEGDWVAFWEYYRTHATIIDHLPQLQANHKRFHPKQYWCDPHMWDDIDAMAGCSPVMLYSSPKQLRDIVQARHPGVQVADLTTVAPMSKGLNRPGSVSAGVQVLSAMLKRRAEPFPWPRLRMTSAVKWGKRGFEEWMEKDTETGGSDDRYSETLKDPVDSFRYPIQRLSDLHCEADEPEPSWQIPVDAYTGAGLDQLCSLRGLGV